MKFTGICFCLLISTAGFSQKAEKNDKSFNTFPSQSFSQRFAYPNAQKLDSNKLGNVYSLPQDGMPCITPNMQEYNNMPNVGLYLNPKRRMNRNIPNLYPKLPQPKENIENR